ncbi:hypothetical protein [Blastococcus sp. VKM Ac-2987]|uniref:hypothetical protein n=1 Tax=Blastococcus sp. VKM Ac-2987 TaxID=3004141 RepID=UPI0022AB4F30|nr:hypothetical protein [Blastococcus sp. VKM Ac-2987]MCZ2860617.1 hypothetical protein [Blastococcus sp. VKM Ac-2987]
MPALDERMQALEEAATRATLAAAFTDVPDCALVLHRDRLELRVVPAHRSAHHRSPWRRTLQGVGAVLLGVRVALAARGWAVDVDRLPCADDPGLLAVARPVGGGPEPGLAPLAPIATAGPVGRRLPADGALPPALVDRLRGAAAAEDALLVPVAARPPTMGPESAARDRGAAGPAAGASPGPVRAVSADTFLLLATGADDELAWIRSGEAVERVLLELARAGWAGTLLPDALDAPLIRARARASLCGDHHPQALIRAGSSP